jgi:hypothetical protein
MGSGDDPGDPVEILDCRFAEGAISLEDYERRRQRLAERTPGQTESFDGQPPRPIRPS